MSDYPNEFVHYTKKIGAPGSALQNQIFHLTDAPPHDHVDLPQDYMATPPQDHMALPQDHMASPSLP